MPITYRYLKDVTVQLKELKIQLCFYSRFLITQNAGKVN